MYLLISLIVTLESCFGGATPNQAIQDFSFPLDTLHYQNPVFEPVLADPTIIQDGNYFYAYGTEDNWGEEGGYHLVPVIRSTDLVNWELIGNSMSEKPIWKERGGIWAPDVTKVGDQYYMYYSFSTWGDPNPGIGLAISNTPQGPFVDQGPVFTSEEIGVKNSIDPFYFEQDAKKFLIWGSFHGLYLTELSSDGTKPQGDIIKLAGNHLEAAYLFKKGEYFYLFGSSGTCCEGANSTYQVLVGRSKSIFGPFEDQKGRKLLEESSGTLVVKSNLGENGFAGPGHNAKIMTDSIGNDWLLYHGMDKKRPKLGNGTNRRVLLMDQLIWIDGWPRIENHEPSIIPKSAPQFD